MQHFDLAIVGTGSGNSIVDERFADWNVALIERGTFGGTCLNVGCIPTKMFVHAADLAATPAASARLGVDSELQGVRWPEVRDRIFGRIDPISQGGRQYRVEGSPNVTVFEGTGRFVGDKMLAVTSAGTDEKTISADRFVLAAGSRPILPAVPGMADVGAHTSDTIMRLETLPKRMVIVGGGFIAAEMAHVFSSFGTEITLVTRSGALLRQEDLDVSRRFSEMAAERWDVRFDQEITSVERQDDLIRVHLNGPDGASTAAGDTLLVAAGRAPNSDLLHLDHTGVQLHPDGRVVVDEYQRTGVEGIWALGDISSSHQLKHVANHETRIVQHNLLHPDNPRASDHRFVPHAVFSSPQVASVGLTEQEALAQGLRFVSATQDYGDIAYGWAMEDTTGFCKLIAEADTGRLLGAHIIGPQAATLIQPLIQAMSFGLDARRMAREQYWIHPAMPELVENALLKLPLSD
ncbi:mycothione reductase [Actinoalloteichus hymeniacidonis]|uniref:Mycothione reductase n=1 Tax=Actinoalloteichus hymeniacidonis TaxID=340345 RepID=A0AAC9HNV7_9PSEU|nr:mycothione reductase [Actinoalloteichus hymeniacidonis]AOS62618.1 mycothione reductase [Actinoalloteichus hymeniacidonis]MBB5909350.1 mycothione reductase [Actinoalloteichus hymeniacidonis]